MMKTSTGNVFCIMIQKMLFVKMEIEKISKFQLFKKKQ